MTTVDAALGLFSRLSTLTSPGRLSAMGARWRHDARMVLGGFQGRAPAPFARRTGELRASTAAALPGLHPRALRVVSVAHETADALSVTLADPTGAPLRFEPGQFFTLLVDIDGEVHRRAYSASNTEATATPVGSVRVTIKRIAGGRVSNHIHDRVQVGDAIRVFGPSGAFVLGASADSSLPLVLIAGGSGITPMLSLARAALAGSPTRRVILVDGNRTVDDIIFRAELGSLAEEYSSRFTVRHVLASPPPGWAGGIGILDASTLRAELSGLDLEVARTEFYLCGPEPMMKAARETLGELGAARELLHEEKFSQPHLRPTPAGAPSLPQKLRVKLPLSVVDTEVRPGQSVLESALAAGAELPFSCTMGGCGACRVKLLEGDVSMEEPNCLTAQERAEGYVLTCVCRANTAVVIEAL